MVFIFLNNFALYFKNDSKKMITIIENEFLLIKINAKGAELDSIFHKKNRIEYLWQGNAAFWGKKSPILFPIVGTLKDNTYFLGQKKYSLPRHGFARDLSFSLEKIAKRSATFLLESNEDTLKVFPFAFALRIHYSLQGASLSVRYTVENKTADKMYFSIGAHPAFNLPLVENTTFEDYFIKFEKNETLGRYPLSIDGLLELEPTAFLQNTDILPLNHALFSSDAVVFKQMSSTEMAILSEKTTHGLRMNFEGFPFFGIWTAKNAPFLCLEPWCGVADSVNASQNMAEKEGIICLEKAEIMDKTWSIELF